MGMAADFGWPGWNSSRRRCKVVKIRQVAVTVARLDEAPIFYRDVLQLPVHSQAGHVTVTVGSSRLVLEPGDRFHGVHHLAFSVAPADFQLAQEWLGQRVDPIVVDGSEVIEGPEGWRSRSVYFLGPEGILLEFIAREADAQVPAGEAEVPRPLSISEVGIGVPDVSAAVASLTGQLKLPTFPPQGTHFAPVGGHDGLVILVNTERIWFPTDSHQAARGPVAVTIEGPKPGHVSLTNQATVLAG